MDASQVRAARRYADRDDQEVSMDEATNRATLERLYDRVWVSDAHDFSVMDEVFAEDAVLEYPQSGERFLGRRSIRRVEEEYPALPAVAMRRVLVSGDLAVVETDLDYDGTEYREVSIFEFRDGVIVRHTAYFAEPFAPSESRAHLRAAD
jgi:ketosteroid isomerase-like protein